jgi:hypothetical protein
MNAVLPYKDQVNVPVLQSGVPLDVSVQFCSKQQIVWVSVDATFIPVDLKGLASISITPTLFQKTFEWKVVINGKSYVINPFIKDADLYTLEFETDPFRHDGTDMIDIVYRYGGDEGEKQIWHVQYIPPKPEDSEKSETNP